MRPTTLCAAHALTAARDPGALAVHAHDGGPRLTHGELRARAARVAAGLAARGVRPGDTVALLLSNRPELFVLDLAVMHARATPFSVYATLSVEQLEVLFADAAPRLLFTERAFAERVATLAARGAAVEVVFVDGEGAGSLRAFEEAAPTGLDLDAAARAVRPDDVLTLIYTSGTTGPPKGVEITHGNMMAQVEALTAVLHLQPGDRTISFLPSAHIADRAACLYACLANGVEITTLADRTRLAAALASTRPTYFAAVPRVWERLQAGIEARLAAVPGGVAALDANGLRGLRAALGLDACTRPLNAAAPLDLAVLEFFAAIGLPLGNVWGMSELSGAGAINPPDGRHLGSVGPAVPGVELRIAEDGELLARGAIVMRGYRGLPEQTREAIDADGWMHTGDVATLDAEGHVRIVNRKKEIIINDAGKNMSPAQIESTVKAHSRLIGNLVCVGDARPYNVALVTLDPEAAAAWARARGRGEAAGPLDRDPELLAELTAAIAAGNAKLSRVEQVKRWRLLPGAWEPGGDELTPTSKLRRRPIAAKYAAEIDALYR